MVNRNLIRSLENDQERDSQLKRNAIVLMTLHSAKGLEFQAVFICGVEDGLIPYRERDEDLAEERRLFYVGLSAHETRWC